MVNWLVRSASDLKVPGSIPATSRLHIGEYPILNCFVCLCAHRRIEEKSNLVLLL